MSHIVQNVAVPLTYDKPQSQAEWFFNDEYVTVTDITPFVVEGVNPTDWDAGSLPNSILITYDGPVEPDMSWDMNPNSGAITFEDGVNQVDVSSGQVEDTPFVRNYKFSADEQMGNGPAALVGFKTNHLALSSVTLANIFQTDINGKDVTEFLNVTPGIWLFKDGDPNTYAAYEITSVTNPQNSNYRQLALTFIIGAGSLANGDHLTLKFYRY